MDVGEKLVELLNEVQETGVNEIPAGFGCTRDYVRNEKVASHLIARGVTVQEWISASEPPKDDLPVLVTCGKGYRPFLARYDLVRKRWRVSHTLRITHWQPLPSTRDLPQPPKGE